jgi:hypothetical protein
VQEEPGRLDDHVDADLAPLQARRILLRGQADLLAVDHQMAAVDRDAAVETAVDRVVLQHVRHVVRVEQIVDRDDLDVAELRFLRHGTEHHAADAAEPVDGNANGNRNSPDVLRRWLE